MPCPPCGRPRWAPGLAGHCRAGGSEPAGSLDLNPAEEPAQACQHPGRARTRQTDCSSSSAGTRAHAAKTAKPAAHAARRDLRDHQARRRTSASKSAVAVLTRTLITQCGQPAGASRACTRRSELSANSRTREAATYRTGCSATEVRLPTQVHQVVSSQLSGAGSPTAGNGASPRHSRSVFSSVSTRS